MTPPVEVIKIIAEPAHHPLFVTHWTIWKKYWSVKIGFAGILILSGIPALNDQFPNIAPSLLHWFPNHGQQWVPILGAVIGIAARIVSQDYVIAQIRRIFKVEPQ